MSIRSCLAPARALSARRVASLRAYSKSPLAEAFKTGDEEDEKQARYRTQKNPKIPSLKALEKRWSKLNAGEQDDIIAYLEDKMREDWKQLTVEEKRAAWYVWFGNWGPRTTGSRDFANMYLYAAGGVALSVLGLAIYKFADYDPSVEIKGIDYDSENK